MCIREHNSTNKSRANKDSTNTLIEKVIRPYDEGYINAIWDMGLDENNGRGTKKNKSKRT